MLSTSTSFPEGNDSLNHNQSGINNHIGPFKGQIPFVPQPMGSSTAPISHTLFVPQPMGSSTAPISHLPPSPGQLQMGSPIQSSKYLIASNSLPVLGEGENNLILQGGNLSLSSHDSSSWSSGFTGALQDNSYNLRKDRKPSPSPESALKVSQSSTSNEFQHLFCEARNIAEHTYSLIRSFFDMSQIQTLEESHRIIDSQIVRLAPFVSQQTENSYLPCPN